MGSGGAPRGARGRAAVGPGGTWDADSGVGSPGWGGLRGAAAAEGPAGREKRARDTGGAWGRSSPGGHSYPLDVGTVGDRAGTAAVSITRPRSEDRWSQEPVGWVWKNARSWGGRVLEFSLHLRPRPGASLAVISIIEAVITC